MSSILQGSDHGRSHECRLTRFSNLAQLVHYSELSGNKHSVPNAGRWGTEQSYNKQSWGIRSICRESTRFEPTTPQYSVLVGEKAVLRSGREIGVVGNWPSGSSAASRRCDDISGRSLDSDSGVGVRGCSCVCRMSHRASAAGQADWFSVAPKTKSRSFPSSRTATHGTSVSLARRLRLEELPLRLRAFNRCTNPALLPFQEARNLADVVAAGNDN